MKTQILRITTAILTAGVAMATAATTAQAAGEGFESKLDRAATMERVDSPSAHTKEVFEIADISATIPAPDRPTDNAAVADTSGADHSQRPAPGEIAEYEFAPDANDPGR